MPLLPVLGRQISVSLRSVWPTWQVPGQTEIRTETLSYMYFRKLVCVPNAALESCFVLA